MSGLLGQLKVGQRLWINVGLAMAAIALVLLVVLVQFRDSQMAQRQLEIRELVEIAYGVIEHHGRLAAAGTLSPGEAKTQSAAAIQALRYGDAGYFWINDTVPTMVMHPHKPELNGKNLAESKDPNGKRLFVSFVETPKQIPKVALSTTAG
jgi:methyl-accepting chemotaxis protein